MFNNIEQVEDALRGIPDIKVVPGKCLRVQMNEGHFYLIPHYKQRQSEPTNTNMDIFIYNEDLEFLAYAENEEELANILSHMGLVISIKKLKSSLEES